MTSRVGLEGEEIKGEEIKSPEPARVDPALPLSLPILYQDNWFVAVHKPAGMLVHRTKLNSNERVFVMQTVRNQIGGHVYPVHRLDKPTSGIILLAKNPESARLISELIQRHAVHKTYMAVVRGWTPDADTIDYAIKEKLDKTTDSKAQKDKPAQEAITDYSTTQRIELPVAVGRYQTARYSLVEMRPKTGRKHQLRRHFKHIFHPIIGDRKYGDRDHNAYWLNHQGMNRMCLCAVGLSFDHPHTGEHITISLNPDFPESVREMFLNEAYAVGKE